MITLKKMSNILLIANAILLSLLIATLFDTPKNNQVLEIYTSKEIIYVSDLCVSFETRQDTLCFAANKHLNEFVSSMTANHVLEHRSFLMKKLSN